MKRHKRKPPAWQCQAAPVLRDVRPGFVAVPIYHDDGSVWRAFDWPLSLVEQLEEQAKKKRWSFTRVLHTIIVEQVTRLMDEKERGF